MTDAEAAGAAPDGGSVAGLTPGVAEGRSRLLLFAGAGVLAVGHLVEASLAVWIGVGVVAVAAALNTVGKLVHYRRLPVPRGDRRKLAASWLLVAATLVGLLANYAYARYGPGEGRFFWTLAVAGIGFGLLHMAAQSKYLPAARTGDDG